MGVKLEVQGAERFVVTSYFFSGVYKTLEEAVDALKLEMWFEKELKGLNRAMTMREAMGLRREYGLPVPEKYKDCRSYCPGEF